MPSFHLISNTLQGQSECGPAPPPAAAAPGQTGGGGAEPAAAPAAAGELWLAESWSRDPVLTSDWRRAGHVTPCPPLIGGELIAAGLHHHRVRDQHQAGLHHCHRDRLQQRHRGQVQQNHRHKVYNKGRILIFYFYCFVISCCPDWPEMQTHQDWCARAAVRAALWGTVRTPPQNGR